MAFIFQKEFPEVPISAKELGERLIAMVDDNEGHTFVDTGYGMFQRRYCSVYLQAIEDVTAEVEKMVSR